MFTARGNFFRHSSPIPTARSTDPGAQSAHLNRRSPPSVGFCPSAIPRPGTANARVGLPRAVYWARSRSVSGGCSAPSPGCRTRTRLPPVLATPVTPTTLSSWARSRYTRSRAEGDGRSDANQCCDMKADLGTIGPEATLKARRCVGPKRAPRQSIRMIRVRLRPQLRRTFAMSDNCRNSLCPDFPLMSRFSTQSEVTPLHPRVARRYVHHVSTGVGCSLKTDPRRAFTATRKRKGVSASPKRPATCN